MSDELEAAFAAENLAESAPEAEKPTSETAIEQEQPDAPETPEKVAEESDEQKNERVQQEAAAKVEKKARGVQKRMDELTAEKYAANKRLDEALELNRKLIERLDAKPIFSQTSSEPQREQFSDDWSFLAAQNAHEAKRIAAETARNATEDVLKGERERLQRETIDRAEHEKQRVYRERAQTFAAKTPDFAETMSDADIPVPETVFGLLQVMEDGPAIVYQMVKNPQLVEQFNTYPPAMHGILLGQISATLKASPSISKAAPPGKPVKSTPGTSNEPPSDPDKFWEWSAKHLKT